MQTPAPVDYVRATSVENAIALLQEHGEERASSPAATASSP